MENGKSLGKFVISIFNEAVRMTLVAVRVGPVHFQFPFFPPTHFICERVVFSEREMREYVCFMWECYRRGGHGLIKDLCFSSILLVINHDSTPIQSLSILRVMILC